ncbi:metallophosphoesterase family protein, partial [Escherichia coli]|uniref:metallophosphoesterase family protein n=1 Tax=Escherichia coli TaxID=562 RepID=UPI003C7660A3
SRRWIHDPAVLAALIDDLKQHKPDHIVVTGDLTNLGLDREIEAARHWLETLAPPDQLTLIPGNHDAYVPGAVERA